MHRSRLYISLFTQKYVIIYNKTTINNGKGAARLEQIKYIYILRDPPGSTTNKWTKEHDLARCVKYCSDPDRYIDGFYNCICMDGPKTIVDADERYMIFIINEAREPAVFWFCTADPGTMMSKTTKQSFCAA